MKNHNKPIQILDCTLREGEQAKNILFSVEEKIQLVAMLKAFGVRLIEIGHPGISEAERIACQRICAAINEVEFLVHARATEAEVLAAKTTGADWVGIWISYNDIALSTKFTNKSLAWIAEQAKQAISLAKSLDMCVRFTIEDASRTSLELIEEIGKIAREAGADRISLADTVGKWLPQECYCAVEHAIKAFQCEIEVHLHNDLGLAQANAIAAIEAGATVIDASILGIGERAGICDLFCLCTYLQIFQNSHQYQLKLAKKLSAAIQTIGAFSCEPHRPIVGKNVFTHTAKYHTKMVERNHESYQFLLPKQFDRTIEINPKELVRNDIQRLHQQLKIGKPFIKGASELLYHRDGIGKRWVCMDNRIDERSSLYVIERIFDAREKAQYQPHVDKHAHHCDSVFVFLGNAEDGSGLTVSVTFGEGKEAQTQTVHSPASVFIPSYIYHSYSYMDGSGRFLNIVLAPNYNNSLVKAGAGSNTKCNTSLLNKDNA